VLAGASARDLGGHAGPAVHRLAHAHDALADHEELLAPRALPHEHLAVGERFLGHRVAHGRARGRVEPGEDRHVVQERGDVALAPLRALG